MTRTIYHDQNIVTYIQYIIDAYISILNTIYRPKNENAYTSLQVVSLTLYLFKIPFNLDLIDRVKCWDEP